MAGPVQRSATSILESAVMDAITMFGGLAPGEVAVHFDLVASARRINDEGVEDIRRYHWSPVGSDPHLSESYLRAQANKIARGL